MVFTNVAIAAYMLHNKYRGGLLSIEQQACCLRGLQTLACSFDAEMSVTIPDIDDVLCFARVVFWLSPHFSSVPTMLYFNVGPTSP